MLCSPKWDNPRAAATTPGLPTRADCTATRAAVSPRGGADWSTMAPRSRRLRILALSKQNGFPLLLARQHRQGLAVDAPHFVEPPGHLPLPAQGLSQQREHLRAVPLPIDHPA